MDLVQSEPFLGLLDAVVVKFVIHGARAERVQQIATDFFRKLAGVNGHVNERHEIVFADNYGELKRALTCRHFAVIFATWTLTSRHSWSIGATNPVRSSSGSSRARTAKKKSNCGSISACCK